MFGRGLNYTKPPGTITAIRLKRIEPVAAARRRDEIWISDPDSSVGLSSNPRRLVERPPGPNRFFKLCFMHLGITSPGLSWHASPLLRDRGCMSSELDYLIKFGHDT